jgi:hypothetical protein
MSDVKIKKKKYSITQYIFSYQIIQKTSQHIVRLYQFSLSELFASSLSPSTRCPLICCTLYHPQPHHIQSFPIRTMPSDMLYIISPTTTSHPVFPHPHDVLRYAIHYITHNHITTRLSSSARCPPICCTLYHPQPHHNNSFPIRMMPSDMMYIISPTTTSHLVFPHPHNAL